MQREKPPEADKIPDAKAELSRYVAFTFKPIDRSQIKNAPYNPRTIDRDARARLLKELKQHGLVEPIVWNLRTGNLVGGHQRLSILDDLHGGAEYAVPASVVDVDEVEEKRKNVALNSPDMQGRYDSELFNTLAMDLRAADPNFNIATDFGLSEITLEAEIGVDSALYLPPEPDKEIVEVLDETEKIKEMKRLKKQHRDTQRAAEVKEAARWLAVEIPEHLSLPSIERRRDAILQALGMPVGRRDPVIPAWQLEKVLGIKVSASDRGDDEEEDLDDGEG
jgi:ParB-like chromosome segregation protein Spo0J